MQKAKLRALLSKASLGIIPVTANARYMFVQDWLKFFRLCVLGKDPHPQDSNMRRKLYGYDIQDKRCPGSMRRRLQETSGTASSSSGPPAVPEHVLPLDRVLGEDWAAGAVTSKQVVKYCAAAVALGARSPQVDVFAVCATWG